MKAPTTQGVSCKVMLIFMLFEIIGLDCRPFMFPDSRPMLPGPDVLESKVTISDVNKIFEMVKGWHDPEAKDVNKTDLLMKLGKNYDSFYMSIDPPKSSRRNNGVGLSMRSTLIRRQDAAFAKMPWHIRQLQFEVKRSSKKRGRVLGYRASSKLRQWLWELSRCPINYSWVDYGPKFFPRHIRFGECIEKACSFPKGMTCRPRSTRTLSLLLWVCLSKSNCKWRPFSLQMHKSCECGCHQG
eukprot:gene8966-16605_t